MSTIVMPESLTAENGAKGLLSGEFFETIEHECEECAGEQYSDDCKVCNGSGYVLEKVHVSWSTIKDIYAVAVKHLGQVV